MALTTRSTKPRLWVTGWLTQGLLLTGSGIALWMGAGPQATTMITGSIVIGTMRQIERERRAASDAA